MNQQYYVIEKDGKYFTLLDFKFCDTPVLFSSEELNLAKVWAKRVGGNVKIATVSIQDFDENVKIRANQKSSDTFGND